MSNDKSFLDKMFDAAEGALTPLEKVLTTEKPAIDAEESRVEDWEKGFEIVKWAVVDLGGIGSNWHALKDESMVTVCGKTARATTNRQVLEPDRVVSACTTCIIGVSK